MKKNSKFERLIVFFKSTLEPPEHLRLDGLRYWQARIFYTLLGIGILLAFFALIPTAWIVIKANLWGLAIFDCSAFLLTVYIWRAHHVSFKLRAKIILLLVYSIGLWVILSVGIISGGPAWLFTFAILSGVFFRGAGRCCCFVH